MPVVLTVATVGLLELQVPPPTAFDSDVVLARQTVVAPVMVPADAPTVMVTGIVAAEVPQVPVTA